MMSQMNVRIDEQLRVEGNRAFEEVGWSPSQAIRALWGYAARNRRNPRKLKELQSVLKGCEPKAMPSHAAKLPGAASAVWPTWPLRHPVGEPQVWLASHYEDIHRDFEDDLVLAALETSKAKFFVTGDKALREKAPGGGIRCR